MIEPLDDGEDVDVSLFKRLSALGLARIAYGIITI